jgi:LCP family protein required for cell wall assembly
MKTISRIKRTPDASKEIRSGIGKGAVELKSRKILVRNIVILVLSVIFLAGGGVCFYADHLLSTIHFVSAESGESQVTTGPLFEPAATSSEVTSAKSGLVGGLCHDDAVTNILLLGVDDYQKNDAGRSDSMMLVSVDNRRNKLKTTSFLRDTYVAIPGCGSNKLNAAYSLPGGKEKGARKVVSTIEANYGIDIDRFVTIDYSVFPKIIDRLGGVEITLTSGEAKLVNAYSGDSKRVKAGFNNLTGLQARYYSRIRAIGNDYERTARQRKVFASVVSKLKNASLVQLNSILADTLPLVTTNMTKNEVLSLASHSLTYLHYPISEQQIPADGEFRESHNEVRIGGVYQDVLVIDLPKNRQTLLNFVYENHIPEGPYS